MSVYTDVEGCLILKSMLADILPVIEIRRYLVNLGADGRLADTTLTDVPFDKFGEGSFDKSNYSIPIDWIIYTDPGQNSVSAR